MSSIPNIRRAVHSMRWAIVPEKLEAIIEVLEVRATQGRPFTDEEIRARLEAADISPVTPHAAARNTARASGGSVAVLPLTGLIAPRSAMVNGASMPEGTACDAFAAAFDAAIADDSVSAIVIDIDSPGGSVDLVPELATRIFSARGKKPITAVANSLAASAAYWIGTAADELVITPSGEVGSIGVFCVHEDDSGAYAQMGIKHTIIRAGEFKAEGNPYEPLSEDAVAAIQSDIDEIYGWFVKAVAKHRGVGTATVEKNFGKGRTVLAKNAVAAGMADRIGTLESVLRKHGVTNAGYSSARAAADTELPIAATTRSTGSAIQISATAGVAAASALTLHETKPAPQGQENTVPEQATASPSGAATSIDDVLAERRRTKEITALCNDHGVEASVADEMIDRGLSVAEASKEILDLKREQKKKEPKITGVHDRALDKPWASFGEQLLAIKEAYSPNGRTDARLAVASGMNQAIPSEGGFLVTPEFSNVIWNGLAAEPDNLLAMTDNYTVGGESLSFPANAETSRANGSRYGGILGYWIAEADLKTPSMPKLRRVTVEPHELAVFVFVTDKLLKNSPVALQQYVERAATDEINFRVGDAIVNGTGVGQPKGLLASGATVSVAKETSQPAATFVKANANKMWSRLHPRSRANAVWLYNPEVDPQFDEFNTAIKNVAGTENVGGFGSQIYNADKNTLKGRPLIPCEYCAPLGTVGDVILADMKGYLTGTRGGIESAMSIHVRFQYDETAFRFVFEVDGQPWLAAPLTPYKGSNTLSTFVTVATRA